MRVDIIAELSHEVSYAIPNGAHRFAEWHILPHTSRMQSFANNIPEHRDTCRALLFGCYPGQEFFLGKIVAG